jgi:hypothetical protein
MPFRGADVKQTFVQVVVSFGAQSIARRGKIKSDRAEQCSAFRLRGKRYD